VLIVEDEPYMAEAIRDGLRLEAIAADIAGDGDAALELLSVSSPAARRSVSAVVRLARLTAPSPTARLSSTTRFRV
jgi:DNA-binding response OmpR family regulator